MLTPLSPPYTPVKADAQAIRQAIWHSKAYGARWTYEWDRSPSEWWWIVCDDRQYDMTQLTHDIRQAVRKGLRRCAVRRVETRWLAENGYPIYRAAHRRYGSVQPEGADVVLS